MYRGITSRTTEKRWKGAKHVHPPARPAPGQRLLLHGVDWRTYSRLLHLFEDRPSLRFTYDQGSLEIMSPTHAHESDADFLGRLAVTLTEELGLPLKARPTTLRRQRRRRGLEPDKCCWIAHEAAVRGKRQIDLLSIHPPILSSKWMSPAVP